ncbi:hypothetical protein NUU61_009466 [Penicillium alfredii]|uniref:DDE-1 domain-containing protein n=1 Tax=Penicillium alfredii TaxID=1506179 RepID=A0A9W9JXQ1_9EURO|nr:uncharacterized protein NUU61_009466 [Penicillium alfredii]KAJ5084887.1 hypothetical protein NUU61_009466 [Penicillium alfredii]
MGEQAIVSQQGETTRLVNISNLTNNNQSVDTDKGVRGSHQLGVSSRERRPRSARQPETIRQQPIPENHHRESHKQKEILPEPDEEKVVVLGETLHKNGHPQLTYARLMGLANIYVRSMQKLDRGHNFPKTLSQNWVKGFLRKRPKLAARLNMGKPRQGNGSSKAPKDMNTQLLGFVDRLEELGSKHNVQARDVYVLGDIGFATTVSKESQMVIPRTMSSFEQRQETPDLASIVLCYGHRGRPLSSYVMVKSSEDRPSRRHQDTQLSYAATGWASENNLNGWLERIFEPETRREEGTHRILLVDSQLPIHEKFFFDCETNNISCLRFPKNGGEILSPLHCGVFQHLAVLYTNHMTRILGESIGNSVTLDEDQFVETIQMQLLEPAHILRAQDAWYNIGIFPVNRPTIRSRLCGGQAVSPPDSSPTPCGRPQTTRNFSVDIPRVFSSPEYEPPSPLPSSQVLPPSPIPIEDASDSPDASDGESPNSSLGPLTPQTDSQSPKPVELVMSISQFCECLDNYGKASKRKRHEEEKRLREQLMLGYNGCHAKVEILKEVLGMELSASKRYRAR